MTPPRVKSARETGVEGSLPLARLQPRDSALCVGARWLLHSASRRSCCWRLLLLAVRSTAAAPARKTVAMLSVQFLNDHADLEPTTDAERARLGSIEQLFKSELEASGRYSFVSIPSDLAAKMAAGPEMGNCGGCEFRYGEQLGADLAAWMTVQKVSDLILNINVYMADIATGKMTFVRSVDIRGNTDESWTRGLTYLVKNYLLAAQK